MQKIIINIFGTLILSAVVVKTTYCQVVPPAQVINYLQQKVNVYYISQPNAVHTQAFTIRPILTASITSNTDGVLFGRGGNNRMSTSARLLLSLLKDRSMGGNGKFQDWVYNLIKIKDKPLNLYFYNDEMSALNNRAVSSLYLDTIRMDNGARLYPGIWRGPAGFAGDINLGEHFFLNRLDYFQTALIDMIASAEIDSYRVFHISGIFSFEHAGYSNLRFYSSSALMDDRFLTDQGVCNGLVNAYDTAYQRTLYRWFSRPSMTLLRQPPEAFSTSFLQLESQKNWLLKNQEYSGLAQLLTTIPQFGGQSNSMYGWFNFSTIESRALGTSIYKLRNEITQSLIYNYCLQKLGFHHFINSLIFNNNRFCTAAPENKLAILLENICRVEMGNQTVEQLRNNRPTDKSYLAPIALVHFLTGNDVDFNYQKFTTYIGQGFPEELFNLYTTQIQTAIRAIQVNRNNPDDWYSIRDQIDTILRS